MWVMAECGEKFAIHMHTHPHNMRLVECFIKSPISSRENFLLGYVRHQVRVEMKKKSGLKSAQLKIAISFRAGKIQFQLYWCAIMLLIFHVLCCGLPPWKRLKIKMLVEIFGVVQKLFQIKLNLSLKN